MHHDKKVSVFISYSHADNSLKEDFLKHLSPLKRSLDITEWHDRDILVGSNLDENILSKLVDYDIILFLISPDFLNSNYCYDVELMEGLRRADIDDARIFPIIVKPCLWKETPLSNFLCIPEDGKPVVSFDNEDDAWVSVALQLKRTITDLIETRSVLPVIDLVETVESKLRLETDYFSKFLNSTEIVFLHSQKDYVYLDDVYIYPDLKRIGDDDSTINVTKSSKSLVEKCNDKILIFGQEQSGKTSLAKKLIKENFNNDIATIYIEAKSIGRTDLNRTLNSSVKQQYGLSSFADYLKLPNKKALVIDDYTEIKINQTFQGKFFENIFDEFDYITIFADDSLKYSEYEYLLFGDFDQYEILPFGHYLRSKLIRTWTHLGQEETIKQDELLELVDTSTIHVDSMLRKNIVPAKPLFILTILQTLQTFRPSDYGLTSYGHCYQHLIQQNLIKASIHSSEIDTYINYMTELSYYIYNTGSTSVTDAQFEKFQQQYSSNYVLNDTHQNIFDRLVSSGILHSNNEQVSFGYKYIFYFYTAKYIADHIRQDDAKIIIESLCEKLHSEKHANILIFITHHSKDSNIIDEIRLYTSAIFEDFSEADLGAEDLKHLKSELEEIPNLKFENKPVEQVREERLHALDDFECSRSEQEVEDEEKSEFNNSDEDRMLADITRSAKSVEIIGQILRNRYGSMKKDELYDLALEAYSAGLRYLKFYLSLTEHHTDDIVGRIDIILESKNIRDRDKIEKIARKILLGLCYQMSIGVIRKISLSIGSDKIAEIFEDIANKNQTPAHKLIYLSIILEFKKEIPKRLIEEMDKDFEGNILCKRLLQEVVIQHIYMHYVSYENKQWISSALKIPVESQLQIESDKKRKMTNR
jgi:hypothetical protein